MKRVNVKLDIIKPDGDKEPCLTISFDIGRLSVIWGDLCGLRGLKVAWYTKTWAYFAKVTKGGGFEKGRERA